MSTTIHFEYLQDAAPDFFAERSNGNASTMETNRRFIGM